MRNILILFQISFFLLSEIHHLFHLFLFTLFFSCSLPLYLDIFISQNYFAYIQSGNVCLFAEEFCSFACFVIIGICLDLFLPSYFILIIYTYYFCLVHVCFYFEVFSIYSISVEKFGGFWFLILCKYISLPQ